MKKQGKHPKGRGKEREFGRKSKWNQNIGSGGIKR
jgi:hypothetical protein